MRLWIVNHYAPPPGASGGPTRHLGLSRELRDRGHDVTIFASVFDHYSRGDHRPRHDRGWTEEDVAGVRYVWIDTPPYTTNAERVRNMMSFALRVNRVGTKLGGPGPDVVIGSSPHLLAPLAARHLAKRRGASFILEVRDLWPQSLVDLGDLSDRHPVIRLLGWLERHLYRTADQIITVLPAAVPHLIDRGATADRVTVIPNGVELGPRRARQATPSTQLTAIYAGTMGLANGLDLAVEAAEILCARGRDDIRIRLVGDGPEREHLRRLAGRLSNVSVEGPVPSEEVPALLATADVGLLILRDSPVFGWGISPTKLFDYMAASLPVVTSVRAPSDIVSAVGAGLAAAPGDADSLAATLEVIADLPAADRRAMGERGRAHVESNHSFATLAEQVELVAEASRLLPEGAR